MALPEVVLVDTSAFYALASRNDEFHERARKTFEALVDREQRIMTTSYVLVETMALIQRRLGFEVLRALIDSTGRLVETLWVEDGLHSAAWDRLEERKGSGPSLVDWTIILSARRLGAHIFAFDSDFSRENVTVLPR